jgi:hypothetical protein
MVATIIIITQDKNKILPYIIPRRIIGGRMQFYQWFKFKERKVESHHNINYGKEIITPLPKKWINDHNHQISDMTTHYDLANNAICKTRVIPTYKPLWPSVLYLIH